MRKQGWIRSSGEDCWRIRSEGAGGFGSLHEGAGGFDALLKAAGRFDTFLKALWRIHKPLSNRWGHLFAVAGGYENWIQISSQSSQTFQKEGKYPTDLTDGDRTANLRGGSYGWARVVGGDCDHCVIKVVELRDSMHTL